MKKLKKWLIIILAFCLVNAFTLQAVYSAGAGFEENTITPHKPEIIKVSMGMPIPEKKMKDDRSWLSRNKWWVVLGVAVLAGGAAAAGGGGGGGGGDAGGGGDDPAQTGDVEVVW